MSIIEKWESYRKNQTHPANVNGYGVEYVYVVYNHYTKLHKIGMTNDFDKRYSSLITTSGVNLEVVLLIKLSKSIDESASSLEQFLHNYFENKRGIGEWFNLNKRDIQFIRDLFWESIIGEDIWDEKVSYPYLTN